ncbi:unnamed protein product [Angiostrongylus costaricensis]|uniref:Uncharacterized protein n=1 Tax=Angiostrongylus costaricensis TaxID=334426 RepID=A0A158PLK2_ANGCS|nr:unnamed protein product [Angiostrongylus costaricensis]
MVRISIVLAVVLLPISISLPSVLNTVDSERAPIRLRRSDILQQPNNERNVFNVKVPAFIESILHSTKNFFVGPSGVITKLRNFVNGKIKVSTHFFGRKIDLQANIPLSLEEVDKALRSFFDKLRADPMTRIFFVMYLNAVVVIVVFLSLIAKHIQISLQSLRSRVKMNTPAPRSTHFRTISPDLTMPHKPVISRQSSELQENPVGESSIHATNDDMSINWSVMVDPSLINSANPNTFHTSSKASLQLTDLRGILASDEDDYLDYVTQLSCIPPCSEAGPSQCPVQTTRKQSPFLARNLKFFIGKFDDACS